jgi:hypothetical protein
MMTILAATTALRATTQALDKDGRDPQRHYEYRVPIQSVAVVEVDVLTPTAQSEVYATAAQANDAELLAFMKRLKRPHWQSRRSRRATPTPRKSSPPMSTEAER